MLGSEYRWWSLDELESEQARILITPDEKWMLKRGVDLYRLWNQVDTDAFPGFDLSVRGKTK